MWHTLGDLLAFGVPWAFGLFQSGVGATFEDDAALLGAYRALPLGGERLASSALVHVLGWLPLGGKVLRASATQAVFLGVFGWLAYRLVLTRVLHGERSRVSQAAALLAALAATLNSLGAFYGATPAGGAVGGALSLGALSLATMKPVEASGTSRFHARRALWLGALTAALWFESRWSGVALCAALGVGWLFRLPRVSREECVGFACGVVLTGILGAGLLLGHLTRLSQASALLRFSFAHSAPATAVVERWVALEAWFGEAGLLGLVLAAAGGLVLMRAARERRLACAFLVFLAFDLFVPGRANGLAPDSAGGLRLMAVLGLVTFSVACARHVLETIERSRVPFARLAAAGALAYALILLLIGVDQGQSRGREDEEIAAATFTSEALASLPAGSALLLRSEAVWRRLLTAQAVAGLRSDLSVVPMPVVESGSVNAEVYAGHTGLLPLIRDMLLSGKPSEYALSALADARPTFVELDPAWDLRLQSHLAPHGFFLAFAPQPLARSERAAEPPRVRRGLLRVAARVRPESGPRASLAQGADAQRGVGRAVVDALARRAALLAGLGDLEPAQQELRTLLEISPSDRGSLKLKQRLDRTPKGRVETRDLFAAR